MNAAETAEEIIDLICSEIMLLDDDGTRILARKIYYYVKPHAAIPEEKPEPVKPMTEQEAKSFEFETMPFGHYAGTVMGNVPLEYLEWLSDTSRVFCLRVHRYLNSPRVKRERSYDD